MSRAGAAGVAGVGPAGNGPQIAAQNKEKTAGTAGAQQE